MADPAAALPILVERALARLQPLAPEALADPLLRARVGELAIASDFAIDTLQRQPALLATLDGPALPAPDLLAAGESAAPTLIRQWRTAESTRLVWRDLSGADTVEDTLAGSTRIAEQALAAGLDAAQAWVAQRHGELPGDDGAPQSLVVFGLGKLGGGELNFSSDIDLIYAFSAHGHSHGPRPLPAEDYFTRIGQRLARSRPSAAAESVSSGEARLSV